MTYLLLTLAIGRLPLGYDCAETPHDYNCVVAEADGLDYSPGAWINWEDSYAHFQVFDGYTTESPLSQRIAKQLPALKAEWIAAHAPDIPVLALVGGRIFIMSEAHKPYYASARRRCPDCVQFVGRYDADDMTQQLIAMRVQFMWVEGMIDDTSVYDTILYYRVPAVWSEYAKVHELSAIVKSEPDIPAMSFAKKWLLTPHDLTYLRMVGPSPEIEYQPMERDSRTAWRRYMDSWSRTKGYEDLDDFIAHERWDPSGDSPMAMQYGPTRGALTSYSWDTYTHAYGVSRDPEGHEQEIYQDEMQRMRADYAGANDYMNRLLGERVALDTVFGRGFDATP